MSPWPVPALETGVLLAPRPPRWHHRSSDFVPIATTASALPLAGCPLYLGGRMLAWCGTNWGGASDSSVAVAPAKPPWEVHNVLVSGDPPKTPPCVTMMHGEGAGGGHNQSLKQRGTFSPQLFRLVPNVSLQAWLPGLPLTATPRLPVPLGSSKTTFPAQDRDFWGSLAASHRPGQQPHVPALACPALSRIPNPSHMVSISLGSAGACWAVSELNFPLSFHAALGTGRSSSLPGPPPRCPFGHVSPGPGWVWGRQGRLLPPLCPQIAAWPCQRRGIARGGAGPGLFALPLALPRGLLPTLGLPLLGCWGQAENVALPPQNVALAPAERGLGSVPRGLVELVFVSPRAGCFGPARVILIVLPCFRN